jgi:fatty-acid peroxygenase
MPQERVPDSTLALLIEGYEYISNRCRRYGSDVFQTRLLLQPTICLRGRDAAQLFYDTDRFQRSGAAPRRIRKTLFGEGGVQSLDGADHHHRKQMFLSLMAPERIRDLVSLMEKEWRRRMPGWERAGRVTLYDEAGRILTRAVHTWAGVPLAEDDVDRTTRELHGMITGGGGLGPHLVRGRVGRRRAEHRLEQLIGQVRDGVVEPPPGRALHVIAWHRQPDGRLLTPHVAAVELLNVLRPTVAVDRFLVFAALALHRHPAWYERLRSDDDELVERFVHEVRRYYPFFPFAVAQVRREFDWSGYRFPRGRRVLLDLYATDHDPRVWDAPGRFDPDRFAAASDDPYRLVPQGGGDHLADHRCAGEWTTIELMSAAVRLLVREMTYRVPHQDLRIGRGAIPALPRSGFVITDIGGLHRGAAGGRRSSATPRDR